MSTARPTDIIAPRAVAVYARLSRAPGGGISLAVQRQEADCVRLAKAKGWTVAEVLVDDDVSAYVPGKRPGYARLVDGIKAGRYDGVVVYDLDRLHRHPWELEEFFRTCDAAGLHDLASVSGDFDLATNDGRLMARIMGAVAKKSSDDASRRLRRKQEELAEAGRWKGGPRPYGYRSIGDGQLEVVPEEAAIITEVARRHLAGDSLVTLADDLTARGVPTTKPGSRWGANTLRQLLVGGTAAAVRTYHGRTVGPAVWPAIIDELTYRRLVAHIDRPEKRRPAQPRKYLLTGGIAVCGRCGRPLGAQMATRRDGVRRAVYTCRPSHPYLGCGGVHCAAEPFEARVTYLVIAEVEKRALAESLSVVERCDDEVEAAKAAAIAELQLVELARAWGGGGLGYDEWMAARRPLQERVKAAKRRQAAALPSVALEPYSGRPGALGAAWDGLSLGQQRAVVSATVEQVVLVPAGVGNGPRFRPERVKVEWR